MALRGRRVLVTGASGFIGSRLVQRMVRDGARVLAWEPRVGLDEGLARTIDWLRENRARFDVDLYHR